MFLRSNPLIVPAKRASDPCMPPSPYPLVKVTKRCTQITESNVLILYDNAALVGKGSAPPVKTLPVASTRRPDRAYCGWHTTTDY